MSMQAASALASIVRIAARKAASRCAVPGTPGMLELENQQRLERWRHRMDLYRHCGELSPLTITRMGNRK